MKPKRHLTKFFALILSGASLFSILLIGAAWINFEIKRTDSEIEAIADDFIATHRYALNLETDRISDYIVAQHQLEEILFLKYLKAEVLEAWGIIEAIAQEKQNLGIDEDKLKKISLASLKGLAEGEMKTDIFVATVDGEGLLNFPANRVPRGSGGSFSELSFQSNPAAFSDIVKSLKVNKEGFFRYELVTDARIASGVEESPMAFFKIYEPYGWIIGTSEYLEDWEEQLKASTLAWADSLTFAEDTSLLIINYDGEILSFPDKSMVGENAFTLSDQPLFQKLVADIIVGAKKQNKGFFDVEYQLGFDDDAHEHIVFYRSVPELQWVVVTWFCNRNLDEKVAERQAQLSADVRTQILEIVVIAIAMLLVTLLISRFLSNRAQKSFTAFFAFFEKASVTYEGINPEEQPFEEFARLAVAANEMIEQRILATELLQENELKFRTIFDTSPQVITILDENGILLDANYEFDKFSHLGFFHAMGTPLTNSFVHPESDWEHLWSELRGNSSVIGRHIQTAGQNGEPPLEWLVFGRQLKLSDAMVMVLIFTDITALKTAETEKLVLQEKLARSNKMEAMGLLAAEVAHDLNNILSGIIGYPQLLLLDKNLTDNQKKVVTEIMDAGQRAAAVVKDLLSISQGVASSKSKLLLNEIVDDYVKSPECGQFLSFFPKAKLEVNLDPQAGSLLASSIHLTRVLVNLIHNAFESLPPNKDGGIVKVETKKIELTQSKTLFNGKNIEPGQYCCIIVSDNGTGITFQDVNKIFEPFFSNKIQSHSGSGTGLGLAIVWNMVLDHQGMLDLETSPEQGTTFTLYFASVAETPLPATSKKRALENYKGAGERILVVDDIDIQRKLATKMLKTLGYEPISVASGEEAVEFLQSEDVDLIVLDMIMDPGINGRETYGRIKEFKPHQKAIIASGMAQTEEVAKAQALGASQFVNKPYTLEELGRAVQAALNE